MSREHYWFWQWSRHRHGFVFAWSVFWYPASKYRRPGFSATLGLGPVSAHLNYRRASPRSAEP